MFIENIPNKFSTGGGSHVFLSGIAVLQAEEILLPFYLLS